MKQSFLAIRAIGAEFAHRIHRPLILFAIIATIILVGLLTWLIALSEWWWLLAIPVLVAILAGTTILVVVGIIIRMVNPRQTKTQRARVKSFADALMRVSDVTQTPKVILLFRIVRDIIAPSDNGFVRSVIDDTASLRSEFRELQKSFETTSR